MLTNSDLIEQVVGCFTKYGNVDVVRSSTDISSLESLYKRLPARFPNLFERLLLAYRWLEVDLGRLRLLPNAPGNGVDGFAGELFADRGLTDVLLPRGFIQFGRAVDGASYDPICFDTWRKRHGGDCPIARLDHEAVLIRLQIRQVVELAPTFRELIGLLIEDGARKSRRE